METVPAKSRGVVSGILQAGYPSGYLLASIVFGLLYAAIGWRGMFMVGAAPALLTLYIRSKVDESPVFLAKERKTVQRGIFEVLRANAGRFVFAIAIMTCFNFFSHGTQDLYPTFLRDQKHFDPHTTSLIAITFNIGAICGGNRLRYALAAHRPAPGDPDRGAAGAAGDPVLGLWRDAADPRRRRLPHAVRRAGCLGRRAGSTSTSFRRTRCAGPSPASPTRSATSSPP